MEGHWGMIGNYVLSENLDHHSMYHSIFPQSVYNECTLYSRVLNLSFFEYTLTCTGFGLALE